MSRLLWEQSLIIFYIGTVKSGGKGTIMFFQEHWMQGWLSWECYCIFQRVWLGKGVNSEHCDLAVCPTAKGIVVDGFVLFFCHKTYHFGNYMDNIALASFY